MEQDGRYYAFHFDDVCAAVNYCDSLVPHVVTRLRSGEREGIDGPAIWFHVAAKSPKPAKGCDLLMTRGAILAALEGGLPTPHVGPLTRCQLPAGAVLVLGDDQRQSPVQARGPRSKETEQILAQVVQLSA